MNLLSNLTPNAKIKEEMARHPGQVLMGDRMYWMEFYWKRYDKHTRELARDHSIYNELHELQALGTEVLDSDARSVLADQRDTKQLAIWYQLLMYENDQPFDFALMVFQRFVDDGLPLPEAMYMAMEAVEKIVTAANEGTTV